MAELGFNTDDVKGGPEGQFLAMCVEAEIKETKKKQNGEADKGLILECKFQIVDGEEKGTNLFDRFNIENDNPTAERIGKGQLKKLVKALGLESITNSDEMLEIPLVIHVREQKNTDFPGSEIWKYEPESEWEEEEAAKPKAKANWANKRKRRPKANA